MKKRRIHQLFGIVLAGAVLITSMPVNLFAEELTDGVESENDVSSDLVGEQESPVNIPETSGTLLDGADHSNEEFDQAELLIEAADSFPEEAEAVLSEEGNEAAREDLLVSGSDDAVEEVGDYEEADTEEGSCGDNLTWQVTVDHVLKISGTGDMRGFSGASEVPWKDAKDTILAVEMEEGMTSIGAYAFSGCNKIKSITIPDSVIRIEHLRFRTAAT
ncbi:MAG: leucine-rich repeat protein [Eubacteriales bacterium]|nr:leucine-rich repeat protein [Eubacteriales bacterium]